MVVCNEWKSVALDEFLESVCESVACTTCDFASACACDFFDCCIASECRKWVSCERSADICSVLAACKACCHELCVFLLAANTACSRVAASNDFAEYSKVWNNVEQTLRAGKSNTEACYNLVEDHECAVLVAKLTNALVVLKCNWTSAALWANWLNDYSCCAAFELVPLQHAFEHVEVVRANFVCLRVS